MSIPLNGQLFSALSSLAINGTKFSKPDVNIDDSATVTWTDDGNGNLSAAGGGGGGAHLTLVSELHLVGVTGVQAGNFAPLGGFARGAYMTVGRLIVTAGDGNGTGETIAFAIGAIDPTLIGNIAADFPGCQPFCGASTQTVGSAFTGDYSNFSYVGAPIAAQASLPWKTFLSAFANPTYDVDIWIFQLFTF